MTSPIAIYTGQLVWAFGSTYPYWPAIVCPSVSGNIENKKSGQKPSVHVKLCANRKSDWVQLDNVFAFSGYEHYVAQKRSMKSILSEADYHKAFDTANNEGWRRAIFEGTFILSKDVHSRLGIFDTLHILDDVNFELNKIASNIAFEDTNPEPLKITEQAGRRRRFLSVKALLYAGDLEPQLTTKETKRAARKSLPASGASSKQQSRSEEFHKALLTYQIDSHPKEILFRGSRVGNVCKICCSLDDKNDGDLVQCSACGDHVHNACLNINNNDDSYIELPEQNDPINQRKRSSIIIRVENKTLCIECQPPSRCHACKKMTNSPLRKCDVKSCSRHYHTDCLYNWKQIEFVDSKLKCPLHMCHTCFAIPNDRTTRTKKFTFCIKCPTAYHLESKCIPAGTIILTQKQHICIRHRSEPRRSVPSLDWCVRCGEEGNTLICCGSCPKTYHMSCLDASEHSDPFSCEDCSNGKYPLYGQMVIAKYGAHPWWPAVIVPPFEIPIHFTLKPLKEHKFCIRFFGDFQCGWMGRGSVVFYAKNEAAKFLSGNQKQAKAFKEAENWFDEIEKRDVNNNNNNNNRDDNNNNHSSSSDNNIIVPIDLEGQSDRQAPPYAKITTLHIVAPAKLTKSKDEPSQCFCNADDPCGPTSNCENREIYIECDPKYCPSGVKCENQCFEQKKFAAVKVVFMDEKKGFGLVADQFINAGQLVMEYVGELITENELERRKSRKQQQNDGTKHFYFMTYSKGLYIDAEKKGNESRFVNHSCVPNCETQKWTVNKVDRIGYFALKDIEKDTELSTNYGFGRGEFHQCFCGEEKCKGVIGNRNLKK